MERRRRPSKRQRSRAARIAALSRVVAEGGDKVIAPARLAFDQRFAREVDEAHPDATPAQRATLIQAARRLYFARLGQRRWANRTSDATE